MLSAETFPAESRGFSFLRCYRLMRGGYTVARAASVWALIDTANRALVRVNDFELGLPTLPPLDLDIGHINLPSEFVLVGEYRVTYADLDRNMHMNNTHYPDMLFDFLTDMSKQRVNRMTLSFLREATYGHTLRVLQGESGEGSILMKTQNENGETCLEAEVWLTPISQ